MLKINSGILTFSVFIRKLSSDISDHQSTLFTLISNVYRILTETKKNLGREIVYLKKMIEKVRIKKVSSSYDYALSVCFHDLNFTILIVSITKIVKVRCFKFLF